jgi:hypothetical protein
LGVELEKERIVSLPTFWKDPAEYPVVVFGMHRSGSSLLSRILHSSEVYMGLLQEHNAEAIHFLSLNQKLLKEHNADWLEPVVVTESGEQKLSGADLYHEHFKLNRGGEVYRRLFFNEAWGWKDPRNTFTLPYWQTLYPKLKAIHLHRDGRDVAMSLFYRNQKRGEVQDPRLNNLLFCFQLWEKYIEQALHYSEKDFPILSLRYSDLVKGEASVYSELSRFVGRSIQAKEREERQYSYPSELQAVALESRWMKTLGYL